MANFIAIALYTVIGDSSRISTVIEKVYSEINALNKGNDKITTEKSADGKLTTLTLLDNSKMGFTINDDADFVRKNTQGMIGFYARNKMKDEKLQEKVFLQMSLFNCIVSTKFIPDENETRTKFLVDSIFAIAHEINAFVFMPNSSLYQSDGKLLIAPDGSSDLTEFNPVANTDIIDREELSKEDVERKERSIAHMKEKGLLFATSLPVIVWESEAKIPSVEEIAKRIVGLFAVSTYSEAMFTENSVAGARDFFKKVQSMYVDVEDYLSPAEKAYIEDESPEQSTCVNFGWRYEGLAVLLWSLGYLELGYPDTICDVSKIASTMIELGSLEELIANSNMRSAKEILDNADITLRYDWACVDARLKGEEAPQGLDSGVVVERHYAFNWLVSADGADVQWDDISTHT